jgi:hypothetical protein
VPCLWHVTNSVRKALVDVPGACTTSADGSKRLHKDIETHLSQLRRPTGVLDNAGRAGTGECGDDSWWRPLVPHYLGPFPTVRHALNLFRPHHVKHPGVVVTAARTRSHVFAAYATWLLLDFHERDGRTNYALKVATTAFDHHFHDPRLVDYLAAATSRGGRIADLDAALKVCETALADRGHSTDAGWRVVAARVALLLSQQARLATPLTGRVDDNGQPIPKRRHHPSNPRRIRPLRFARGARP